MAPIVILVSFGVSQKKIYLENNTVEHVMFKFRDICESRGIPLMNVTIQMEDPDFHDYVDFEMNETDLVPNFSKFRIVFPQFFTDTSSASETYILPGTSNSLDTTKQSPPVKAEFPDVSQQLSAQSSSYGELAVTDQGSAMEKDPNLNYMLPQFNSDIVRDLENKTPVNYKLRIGILEGIFKDTTKKTLYPKREFFSIICSKLVEKYPHLKDSWGPGHESWKMGLRVMFKNRRRKMNCIDVELARKKYSNKKPLEEKISHRHAVYAGSTVPCTVNVSRLMFEDGKMIAASKYGQIDETKDIELSDEEQGIAETIKDIWKAILGKEVEDETDFFKSGAGSMDVARLVEELKEKCNLEIENEDVYMSSAYDDFVKAVLIKRRGGTGSPKLVFTPVRLNANNMEISFPTQLFINNQFVDASSGNTLKTVNPSDESVICEVQCAGPPDVDRAVQAAKVAFEDGEWGKMNARDRGKLMFRLADLMEQHKQELATLESLDSGAVYTLALKTHIGMSIDTFRYFAGWCDKIQGHTIPINHARPNRNLTITKREPIGVCAIVTPWNYPLMMVAWKLAACLAAGNTCVLKPAQVCPLTALKLAELSVHAGFPPGVINILPGRGGECGQALADHPEIRKLGFTGSTPIGKQIMKSCAVSNLKRCSLELGGKSPLIIFADCDLDRAVRQGMGGVFFNKGENCIAAGRLFVEESIHDDFVNRVLEEVKKMVIGNPLDRSTAHGPQNHKAHLDKLVEYSDRGVQEGAKLLHGGRRLPRQGFFFEPTIFTDVEDHMFIAKEESFGPIMIVSKFKNGDVDGVLRRANATEFGLASGVFTKDLSKALYVSEKIEAGTCFVNCYNKTDVAAPFGGFKQSGCGKDLGQEALNEYLKTKCITIEY